MTTMMMPIKRIANSRIAHPFGDTREVSQAMGPMMFDGDGDDKGITAEEDTDPFLMCDYFNSTEMDDLAKDDDDFPIGWHPHRGFDIATYLVNGKGRHGDSLGNRTTFESPGMQWMSTGSGVYHAEGGANPKGTQMEGFQIWINVPTDQKLDEPRYGTVQPDDIPCVELSKTAKARVLAGTCQDKTGPFLTVQPVQMLDIEISKPSPEDAPDTPATTTTLEIPEEYETAILFVYQGSLQSINNDDSYQNIQQGRVILLDASQEDKRQISVQTGEGRGNGDENAASIMLFAGKRLNQPIAWEGPIVMSDEYDIANTHSEIRGGFFPPVCVDWDYRTLSSKPTESK